jgi:long-chain acyl-CoA synthetase
LFEQLLTIQHWLAHHAVYRADHTALVYGNTRLTYHQLHEQVSRLANALSAAGIRKGDKVATLLYNSIELYETYWACAALGAVCVPLSPLLRGQGLYNLLDNADASLVITCKPIAEHLDAVRPQLVKVPENNFWCTDEAREGYASYHACKEQQAALPGNFETVTGHDPYNIIYSSGTTGLPKGIVISHAVRALYGSLMANAYRFRPESVAMHSGSLVFNGAFLTLMPVMYLGCTFVLLDHFRAAEAVDIIAKEKVTHTILVPSQIMDCLQEKNFNQQQLPSLEYVLSVGAPLLQENKDRLNEKIPGVFYELYGLTEGFMTILDKTDVHRKSGSVGRPPVFSKIKIVDDAGNGLPVGEIGEITGSGPLLMTGYYKQPELTDETIRNGWLFTGDLGYVDKDGFLFLTGRKKDLIISGGVNVYPTDLEQVVIRHPLVKDVAVFGVPHTELGETPVAAVVLNEAGRCTPQELIHWTNQHIEARYQKVSDVMIIDELPRNIAGKVLKRVLKEKYEPMG